MYSTESDILSDKANILNKWVEHFQTLYGMVWYNRGKFGDWFQWTEASMDEVEEIPLPTLDNVKYAVI
jgi:hypothetical protein